jgi:hypothetical protein
MTPLLTLLSFIYVHLLCFIYGKCCIYAGIVPLRTKGHGVCFCIYTMMYMGFHINLLLLYLYIDFSNNYLLTIRRYALHSYL